MAALAETGLGDRLWPRRITPTWTRRARVRDSGQRADPTATLCRTLAAVATVVVGRKADTHSRQHPPARRRGAIRPARPARRSGPAHGGTRGGARPRLRRSSPPSVGRPGHRRRRAITMACRTARRGVSQRTRPARRGASCGTTMIETGFAPGGISGCRDDRSAHATALPQRRQPSVSASSQ